MIRINFDVRPGDRARITQSMTKEAGEGIMHDKISTLSVLERAELYVLLEICREITQTDQLLTTLQEGTIK